MSWNGRLLALQFNWPWLLSKWNSPLILLILYQARHFSWLFRSGKCTLFSRPFPARFHVFSWSYDPANTLCFTKYSNCLSLVIANLPTFIGNMWKTSLISLSHCLLDLPLSLFPPNFPSALANKKSKPVFSTYGVFFSEFLPSLFLKMLDRTVTEDQTRQKLAHVSVVQSKLIAYFSRNSKLNCDRGHFPHCRNYRKTDIQC